jgi:hypothetical protein
VGWGGVGEEERKKKKEFLTFTKIFTEIYS